MLQPPLLDPQAETAAMAHRTNRKRKLITNPHISRGVRKYIKIIQPEAYKEKTRYLSQRSQRSPSNKYARGVTKAHNVARRKNSFAYQQARLFLRACTDNCSVRYLHFRHPWR